MKSLKNDSPIKTLKKIVRYPFIPYVQRFQEKQIFRHSGSEDKFTAIYKLNYWSGSESVSGVGSNLANTENLRKQLPLMLSQFAIKSVFDAPCGDFNWMKHFLKEYPVDYTGADIVLPLVESLNTKFGNDKVRFLHIDIAKDTFPMADLMICRDCLFHLSYHDTRLALKNFVDSNIPYLLTSTHVDSGNFAKKDIVTGAFRFINLFSAPYFFSTDTLYRISDSLEKGKETDVCLWSRSQVIDALDKFVRWENTNSQHATGA